MAIHNAPPVVYPVGRSHSQGYFLLGIWLAGVLALVVWYSATIRLDWRMALAVAVILCAAAAAHQGWRNIPTGFLIWDGQVWCWESASYQTGIAEYGLAVVADFQHMFILRLENQACAKLWLYPEKSAQNDRWLDLRRAVYSPGRSAASNDAMSPNTFTPVEQ